MNLLVPPVEVVAANLLAVLLIWCWAILAGVPFAALGRIPLGFAASPLYGLAYWAAALYLLPFRGGLDAAMVVAAAAGATVIAIRRRSIINAFRRRIVSPTTWLLGSLFLSLHTVPLLNYVPIGMDATMHATSARLIAEHRGPPSDHAPFATPLPFAAVNLGLPTLAAAAVRCGASPSAATLATGPFAYFGFVSALYLVLRPWLPRFGAAGLATIGFTGSRGLQETICWGGYPTVAGFALGLLAARVLFDLARRPSLRTGAAAGFLVAALPLVHGIGAAVWVYVCGPLVLVAGIARVRRWRPVLAGSAIAGAVGIAVLGAYLTFGRTGADSAAREWTREYQNGFAPKGEGLNLLKSAVADIVRWSGDEAAIGCCLGIAGLLARRRWREAGALTLGVLSILAVVVNSARWILPGSMALYPERAPYLVNALSALALALAWRALPHGSRRRRRTWAVLLLILVAASLPKYWGRYQKTALVVARPLAGPNRLSHPAVGGAEYEALLWCRDHLDPTRDVVRADYNSAGSYLPAVAGIATTGWHIHCFILPFQKPFFAGRPPTYRFVLLNLEGEQTSIGEAEVFRNTNVAIYKLTPP